MRSIEGVASGIEQKDKCESKSVPIFRNMVELLALIGPD